MQHETDANRTMGAYPEARQQVHQHVYPPPQQNTRINLPARNIQPQRNFPSYKHLLHLTPNLYAGLNAQLSHNPATVSPLPASRNVFTPPLIVQKSSAKEKPSHISSSHKSDDDDTSTLPMPVRTARNRKDSDVPFLLALAHLSQRALDLGEAPDFPETSVHGDGLNMTPNEEEPEAARPAEGGEDAVVLPTATVPGVSTFCGDEVKGGWNIAAWQNLQESRSFGVIPHRKGLGADDADNMEKDSVQSDTWAEDNSDTDWEHLSQFQDD